MTNETGPRVKRISAKKPQPVAVQTLDDRAQGETPSLGRPRVRIRQCRAGQLLDKDNLYGSIKSLLDGLCHAGLIPGDSESQIDLEVTQTKVAHREDQQTLIEIIYAEAPNGNESAQ